ncbi:MULTISPECIES: hypothetical protein [Clostridium]|uniref:Uncharacterized protein n=1 Tax=Clostridium frigoriphilum TaxID=443253 RepID=A0ABU7UKB4_9CLOT|nr:hypothetical protein [Clostridium sp. DSM 17811]MBU3098409.1 hypothetical protein [Clostridium sp. DSM 17811]
MKDNWNMDGIEKVWDSKTEAHNNIINYLESKGLDEKELLKFAELLNRFSESIIKLNNCI